MFSLMYYRYTLWRRNVRNKKMSEARGMLKTSLFILHPMISTALLQIRYISHRIGALRLCKIEGGRTYTIPEFVQEQQNAGQTFLEALEMLYQQIRNAASTACEVRTLLVFTMLIKI